MLSIKRTCTNKIITRAIGYSNRPLLAIVGTDFDDCEVCRDREQLIAVLEANPGAMVVYNQQEEARAIVDSLELADSQVFIEIRQDTKGVLGLHAMTRNSGLSETIELNYH